MSNFYPGFIKLLPGVPEFDNELPALGLFVGSSTNPEHPDGSITAKGFDRDLFLSIILGNLQLNEESTPSWVTEELPNVLDKDLSEFLELKGHIKGVLIEADGMNTIKFFKLTEQELNELNSEEEFLQEPYEDAFTSLYENLGNRSPSLDADPLYEVATANSAEDIITLKSRICFGKNEDFDLRHYSYSVSDISLIPNEKHVVLYLSTTNKETMETKVQSLVPAELLSGGDGIQAGGIFDQGPVPLVFNPIFTLELSQYPGDIYNRDAVRFLHATVSDGKITDQSTGADGPSDPLLERYLKNLNRLAEGFVSNPTDKDPSEILNYILPLDKTMAKVLIEFLPHVYKILSENFEMPQLLTTYGNPSNWIYEFKPINVKATPVPSGTSNSEFDPEIDIDGYDFFQTYNNIGLGSDSLNIDSNWVVKYIGEPLDLSGLQPPEDNGDPVSKAEFYVSDTSEDLFYFIEIDGVLYNNNFTENLLDNFLNLGSGFFASTSFDATDESLVVFTLYENDSGAIRNVRLIPTTSPVNSNVIVGSPTNSYNSQNKTLEFKIITQAAE